MPDNLTATMINHLWQSTVVVAIAWPLTLMLRKNHARARYWVWMAASVKFLLPFSLLMTAGEWLRSLVAAPIVAKPAFANAMEQIAQPFPQTQFLAAAEHPVATHSITWLPVLLVVIWICGALIVVLRWARGWVRIRAAMRAASPLALAADVPVLCSSALIEPGIFGIFRPVLLLPEGILERLTPEQLKGIIAHEMCHVRRRDNLTFAVHMIVEALFWFHPAVWWIGTRLVEERERACDEAVVQSGSEAEVYAEGILNVCKFYVESPLECVAGVTGADLKSRIVRILTMRGTHKLTLSKKLMLGAAGLMVVAVPVVFGLANATPIGIESQAESTGTKVLAFEVVSVRQSKPGSRVRTKILPDGYSATDIPLKAIISNAYGIRQDLISGAPGWTEAARYDIEAKEDESVAAALQKLPNDQRTAQIGLMLQALLADRFHLKVNRVAKELPIYELIIAKGGFKLKEADPYNSYASGIKGPDGAMGASTMLTGFGQLIGQGIPMSRLATNLSYQVGRTVVDKTGLAGKYDFTLRWAPDEGASPTLEGAEHNIPSPDASGPSIFTALQEQLGLKLESTKGPVETLVVDNVEQPSPN